MSISVSCPGCALQMKAPNSQAGKKSRCPKCAVAFFVPAAIAEAGVDRSAFAFDVERIEEPKKRPRKSVRDDEDEEEDEAPRRRRRAPAREAEDEPRSRRRRSSFQCPYCGTDAPPRQTSKISGAGWTLFIVMAIFLVTILFCWVPLIFMKEEYRSCSDCGNKLG